jgi:uncharacterized protein (TIGR02117 family)
MRVLISVLVCAALTACSGLPGRLPAPAPTAATYARVPVYVVKRGSHIDIGIALADAQPPLRSVAAAFPGYRYLLFGFGDRRYLLQGGVWSVLEALWGGAGLVLVTSLTQQPEQVFGTHDVIRVALTPQQQGDLQGFIGRTFARPDGGISRVAPGAQAVGSYSAFYESVKRYSALHTCNTWAAQALESAGLPVDSSGVEFAWQLWRQLRRLETTGTPMSPGDASETTSRQLSGG